MEASHSAAGGTTLRMSSSRRNSTPEQRYTDHTVLSEGCSAADLEDVMDQLDAVRSENSELKESLRTLEELIESVKMEKDVIVDQLTLEMQQASDNAEGLHRENEMLREQLLTANERLRCAQESQQSLMRTLREVSEHHREEGVSIGIHQSDMKHGEFQAKDHTFSDDHGGRSQSSESELRSEVSSLSELNSQMGEAYDKLLSEHADLARSYQTLEDELLSVISDCKCDSLRKEKRSLCLRVDELNVQVNELNEKLHQYQGLHPGRHFDDLPLASDQAMLGRMPSAELTKLPVLHSTLSQTRSVSPMHSEEYRGELSPVSSLKVLEDVPDSSDENDRLSDAMVEEPSPMMEAQTGTLDEEKVVEEMNDLGLISPTTTKNTILRTLEGSNSMKLMNKDTKEEQIRGRILARDVLREFVRLTASAVRLKFAAEFKLYALVVTAEELMDQVKDKPLHQINDIMVSVCRSKISSERKRRLLQNEGSGDGCSTSLTSKRKVRSGPKLRRSKTVSRMITKDNGSVVPIADFDISGDINRDVMSHSRRRHNSMSKTGDRPRSSKRSRHKRKSSLVDSKEVRKDDLYSPKLRVRKRSQSSKVLPHSIPDTRAESETQSHELVMAVSPESSMKQRSSKTRVKRRQSLFDIFGLGGAAKKSVSQTEKSSDSESLDIDSIVQDLEM